MIATLVFGAIGFATTTRRWRSSAVLGLTGRQKLLAQLLIAVGVWAVLFISTKYSGPAIIPGMSVFRF